MPTLTLETTNQRTAFAPGEPIDGLCGWEFDDGPPAWVEVRLFWQTLGKGDKDIAVAEVARFESPATVDAQTFHFTAPPGPLSYEGRLIEVRWGLELVAHKVKETATLELTLTPTGEPVKL
jgi:hypothetical protein